MRKKNIKMVLFVALAIMLLALPLVACAQPAPAPAPTPAPAPAPAEQVEPIKIGAVLDLTGPIAQFGHQFRNVMEMRFEEANYEAAGRPIEFIIEDGATDIAISQDKVRKLVERDQVNVILGPLQSDIAMAATPYMHEHGVTSICLDAHPLEIREYGSWIVYAGTLYSYGWALGGYAVEELGYKTAVSLGADYVAGYRFVGGVLDSFKEAGGTVIQEQWAPIDTADYGPYYSAMKDADVLLFWTPGSPPAMKQYFEFGMEAPVLFSNANIISASFFEAVGDPALGMRGSAGYVSNIDNPLNKSFVAKFREIYGRSPDQIDAHGYIVTSMLLAALEKTGGDTTFETLQSAYREISFDTINGPVSIDSDGIAISNRYIVEARKVDGEYVWEAIATIHQVRDPRR